MEEALQKINDLDALAAEIRLKNGETLKDGDSFNSRLVEFVLNAWYAFKYNSVWLARHYKDAHAPYWLIAFEIRLLLEIASDLYCVLKADDTSRKKMIEKAFNACEVASNSSVDLSEFRRQASDGSLTKKSNIGGSNDTRVRDCFLDEGAELYCYMCSCTHFNVAGVRMALADDEKSLLIREQAIKQLGVMLLKMKQLLISFKNKPQDNN